jgi:2-keto-3-deoxy-L-rhamnonate aldolase RhmA
MIHSDQQKGSVMFQRNRMLEMLENKQLPLGIQMFTADAALIEVVGATGFDFVMLDSEHSGANPRNIEDLVRACIVAGVAAYVRVPDPHNATDIRRALEAGAEGIFLPEIRSVDDINAAAQAAFFPPKGDRGICPSVRAANFNFRSFNRYADWNNREINLIPMIENPEGVELIDQICSHPDVHVVIFGQGDLAFSLGEGTQMGAGRKAAEAYRKILAGAKKHNVAVMGGPVLTPDAEGCRTALEDGVRVFCLGLDAMAFRSWCEATVRALADGIKGQSEWRRPAVPEIGFPATN